MSACTLAQIGESVAAGFMPADRIVWLGLGMTPPKRSAIKLEIDDLPTDDEYMSLVGLDIMLTYCGNLTKYNTLLKICGALLHARPRRLQIIDIDGKHIAFLKLGGA